MANKDVYRGPGYNPVKGRGYFNTSVNYSEFTEKTVANAMEPFVVRDGEAMSVDIRDPKYREAMDKAWDGLRPDLVKDIPSKLWTVPHEHRQFLELTALQSRAKSMDEFDELADQAGKFGIESLDMYQKAAVEMGRDDFAAAIDYASACGELDPDAADTWNAEIDPYGELRNTGRFVTLDAPNGDRSGFLMEMRPLNGQHRFLDLECPEGEAQILTLEEGTYSIHGVWAESPLLTAGLESARKYFAEHDGLIPHTECGPGIEHGKEAERKTTQLDRMREAMAETDSHELDGPEGSELG